MAEKSILILKREFADGLKVLIENSNLPSFVLSPILADCHRQLVDIENQQYQEELLKYNEDIRKENKNGSE